MKYSQQRKQAVIETVGLNESERAEYCRRRGFYPQQVTARPEMTVYEAARRLEPFCRNPGQWWYALKPCHRGP